MAPDRVAAVNLGKQMVARDLFHHVVNAHDFEVRVDLAKLSLSQPIIRSKILPLSQRTFFMDLNRTVIIFIASMRVLCLWIRATRAAN